MSVSLNPYGIRRRGLNPRVLLHQRGLRATYLHLHEAHIVNVGTAATLPTLSNEKAGLASGDRMAAGQRLRSSRGSNAPLKRR